MLSVTSLAMGLLLSAPPLISGGVYPADLSGPLVLYGGGADAEAQVRFFEVLKRRPADTHAWAAFLALWWRRPPDPDRLASILPHAPPAVRALAGALWPAETAMGEESKEQRLVRISPAMAEVLARHAGDPLVGAMACYLRSQSEPEKALAECRVLRRLDPALLPAARGELFALAALGRSEDLRAALWPALREHPEDLGVAWRFFEDVEAPRSHAERWAGFAPFLALRDAHPIALRALERMLDDPSAAPFEETQLRRLLGALGEEDAWWVPARPRMLDYLAAHLEHLADPEVRAFVTAADRDLAAVPLGYPSSEQRQARLLAAHALERDGRISQAKAALLQLANVLRPVHRTRFVQALTRLGVSPGHVEALRREALRPLHGRDGRRIALTAPGPSLVVISRGECQWTRRLATELAAMPELHVSWISRDAVDAQPTALAFLESSGVQGRDVLFTRAPGVAPAMAVDVRLGIEVSPHVLLFDEAGALVYEWEGWPAGGMRAAVAARLGHALEGLVLEDATGLPVHGATVAAELPSGPQAVETDPAGRFGFARLPAGWVTLTASRSGVGWERVRLETGKAGGAVVRLRPAGSIVGRVPAMVEERGAIRLPALGLVSEVEDDGTFRVDAVPRGRVRVEWVRRHGAGGPHVRVTEVEVHAGAVSEAVFAPGTSVSGRVTLEGEPLEGTRVGWVRWEGETPGGNLPTGMAMAVTDADGQYTVDGLEPGRYTVAVRADRLGALREATVLGEGEQTFDVSLSGEVLEGTVVDAATALPIPGAEVFAYDARRTFAPVVRRWALDDGGAWPVVQAAGSLHLSTTDDGGRFTIVVEHTANALEVRAPGYLAGSTPLHGDSGEMREPIQLRRAAGIRGILLDGLGRPAPGARIFARFGGTPVTEARAVSGEDGRFHIEQVPAGPYDLVGIGPDAGLAVVHGVAVADDPSGTEELTLRLFQGGGLAVRGAVAGASAAASLPRVLDRDGLDLVPLLAHADDARAMPRLLLEKDGFLLRLPLLPAGEYFLHPASGRPTAVRVLAGHTAEAVLRGP